MFNISLSKKRPQHLPKLTAEKPLIPNMPPYQVTGPALPTQWIATPQSTGLKQFSQCKGKVNNHKMLNFVSSKKIKCKSKKCRFSKEGNFVLFLKVENSSHLSNSPLDPLQAGKGMSYYVFWRRQILLLVLIFLSN